MSRALKYAFVYLLLGSLWIILSDILVFSDNQSHGAKFIWELSKGLLYVVISAVLVYILLRRSNDALKKEKREIERRESLLNTIVNNANEEFLLFNRNGELLHNKQQYVKLAPGGRFSDYLRGLTDDPSILEELEKLSEHSLNKDMELEREVVLPSNNHIYRFLFIPISEHQEQLIIVQDETAQLHQIKMQKQNELILNLVLSTRDIGLREWSLRMDQVRYNENALKIMGAATYDEIPQHREWMTRIHPDDQAEVSASYNRLLQGATDSHEAQYRILTLHNTYKWIVEYAVISERDDNEEPVHLIGVFIDFDRYKKHEETVHDQKQKLQQVAFANSHKIRGPLARMLGLIQLCEEQRNHGVQSEDEIDEILEKLKTSALELDTVLKENAEIIG